MARKRGYERSSALETCNLTYTHLIPCDMRARPLEIESRMTLIYDVKVVGNSLTRDEGGLLLHWPGGCLRRGVLHLQRRLDARLLLIHLSGYAFAVRRGRQPVSLNQYPPSVQDRLAVSAGLYCFIMSMLPDWSVYNRIFCCMFEIYLGGVNYVM